MLYVIRHSWALLLGILLLMLGNGLQGTLLGVRGSLESMSTATMGYVMSAYYIGFLGASMLTPGMLQRVGHVRVFAALGSLLSAAFILFAAYVNPVFWFFLRLLVGFCVCGIYVVAESWLNASATNDTRGQALSLYLIVQMTGIVLGQLLLNVADPGGYELFVLITVLVSISFAPILLSSQPAPVTDTAKPMSFRALWHASPLACFGSLLLGGAFATLFGMSSVYATQRGLSVAQTSGFVTAIFLGGLVFQYPIGWISDRMDRRVLIIGVSAVGALTAYVGMLAGSDYRLLLVIALVIGGMSNPLYSLMIAHANDHLEVEQMASASGGLLFINGLGAMSGPIVVGFLMAHYGVEWFFVTLVLLLSSVTLYGIYRTTRRAPVATEDLSPYVAVSSTTSYLATELATETAWYEAEESRLEADEEADENLEPDHIDSQDNDEKYRPGDLDMERDE